MTTLTILPTYEQKQLKCYGTVAAGEHVAVTVTGGADLIGEGKSLRLRVLFGPNTVAMFPLADTDEWTVENVTNAACTLDLFTDKAEKYLRFGGKCLWLLEDMENHTLYAAGEHHVRPWPKEKPGDEPTALDDYPELVEDMAELKGAWTAYQATIAAELAAKQDAIADLTDIRTGAGKGATALQPNDVLSGDAVKDALLPGYVNGASYDSNAKEILLKHGSAVVARIDASAFVKDGMISSVAVSGGNLVITFNTDSGQEPISIPLTDIFDPNNYYDKTAADARFASKADATLAERGYTEWTILRAGVDVTSEVQQPTYGGDEFWNTSVLPADGVGNNALGDESSTTLEWEGTVDDPELGYIVAYTATRTALPGCQLGSQADKPLALEAEAEALRQGKLDKTAVVAPSTSASDSGKAADAKATGDALAARPTKAQIDEGWWSDWTILREGVDVTAQITNPPEWNGTDWDVGSSHISDDSELSHIIGGGEDATSLEWNAEDGEYQVITYTATRHRVAAPVPTKPEDIGAQAALSAQQLANIAAVPNKANTSDLPSSETWTFEVDDGQGGTTTVTKSVAVYAAGGNA